MSATGALRLLRLACWAACRAQQAVRVGSGVPGAARAAAHGRRCPCATRAALRRPLSDEELDAMLPGPSEGYKVRRPSRRRSCCASCFLGRGCPVPAQLGCGERCMLNAGRPRAAPPHRCWRRRRGMSRSAPPRAS